MIDLGTDCPPKYPCHAGIYLSNLWYGHQQILIDHMGLDPCRVAIPGKLQHGWQPGTGLDGEQGMRQEVTHGRDPFYVWGDRQLRAAKEAGLAWGAAVGAPFLYTGFDSPPRPTQDVLLAFPTHSVNGYVMIGGWQAYASDLATFARAEGFTRTIVCLGYLDHAQPDVRSAFETHTIESACLGGPFNRDFLRGFVGLIADATAVVSDRACSAGFYAMRLGRPFCVRGAPLMATNGEDLGPAGDDSWLAANLPQVRGRFCDDQSVALHELGDYTRKPSDLLAAIFRPALRRWRVVVEREST